MCLNALGLTIFKYFGKFVVCSGIYNTLVCSIYRIMVHSQYVTPQGILYIDTHRLFSKVFRNYDV